ncbi:secretion system apparatus [Pandoraea pneumonica]|jgi:hypothetical protein|uniref:Secretion system apparatus n=1 Tax=Pandoraea pneumonica TaxID=2508299 RepID=A0A5E4W4S6_9BURK|nr:hypothetical protein [Pandoraea pneumonica]VVE19153.1 secretion system apparatus [Pandoraea pneumonica]
MHVSPIDLQTQRKLEQLVELMALPPRAIEPCMRVSLSPCLLMIEAGTPGVTLALTLIDRAARAERWLPLLLQTCAPEWSQGIPVKACVAQGRPMLIATPPAASRMQAGDWLQCLTRMRRVLERIDREQQRDASCSADASSARAASLPREPHA